MFAWLLLCCWMSCRSQVVGGYLIDDVGDCSSLKAPSSLSSRQISEETRLSAAAPPHLSYSSPPSSSSSCCSSAVAPPVVTNSSVSSSSSSSSSCPAQQAACPSQGNHVCIRLCRAEGGGGFYFCCKAAARQECKKLFLCSFYWNVKQAVSKNNSWIYPKHWSSYLTSVNWLRLPVPQLTSILSVVKSTNVRK